MTVTAGLFLLVYGLTRAEEAGFGSPPRWPLALALFLLATFLFVERSVADPLVPLRVFRSPDLSGSALVAFANTATTSSGHHRHPLPAGGSRLLPDQAGLLGLPFSLSVVMGSFLGSRLTGSLGARRTMALGLLGICGATLLISGISAEGGLPYVLSNAVLAGLSLGCSAVASTTRGTAAVEGEERGLASGVLNSSAQIGTALGLAALITVAAARTGALAGGEEASAAAVVEGFRAAFYVATGLAVAGALVPLLLMRGKEQAPLERGRVKSPAILQVCLAAWREVSLEVQVYHRAFVVGGPAGRARDILPQRLRVRELGRAHPRGAGEARPWRGIAGPRAARDGGRLARLDAAGRGLVSRLGSRPVVGATGLGFFLALPLLAWSPSLALLVPALAFAGASGGRWTSP